MAARQQQKVTGLKIQYEDLVPKSEWKYQPEATLLTIDLPGFEKEQIKVTFVHTSKMIRVTGERPVADRKWSRFNEVFTVPQNCIVDKIHGSFKNNVLTITMPKETITKMDNLPESSRTVAERVEKLEEKRLLEESRRKEKEEEIAQKKKLLEEKEELIRKLLEEAKTKEMAELRRLQEEAIAKEKAEAKKLQEEAVAKEKAEAKKLEEEEAKSKESPEERKLAEEATLEKILKPEERKLQEIVYTKFGPASGTTSGHKPESKSGSGRVSEVVKSAEENLGYVVEKEKKIEKGIMEKIRSKEITGEEKKMMVNVGVAALVIFALGAYVSYSFCSSSSSSSPSSSSPSSSSSSTKPE